MGVWGPSRGSPGGPWGGPGVPGGSPAGFCFSTFLGECGQPTAFIAFWGALGTRRALPPPVPGGSGQLFSTVPGLVRHCVFHQPSANTWATPRTVLNIYNCLLGCYSKPTHCLCECGPLFLCIYTYIYIYIYDICIHLRAAHASAPDLLFAPVYCLFHV